MGLVCHLTSPAEYWTRYLSVAVGETSFAPGELSGKGVARPTSMNTHRHLVRCPRRNGRDDLAAVIVQWSFKLIEAHGWRESYNPLDGTGGASDLSWSAVRLDVAGG